MYKLYTESDYFQKWDVSTLAVPAKSSQSLNWKLLYYISDGVKRLFSLSFYKNRKSNNFSLESKGKAG